jgi:hypothetical protein
MFQGDITTFTAALSALKTLKAQVNWGQINDPLNRPFVVITGVAGSTDATHGGANALRTMRISFQCSAATQADALTISEAVKTALHGVVQTIGSFSILSAIHQSDVDFYDGSPLLYSRHTDFVLQYR